MTSKSRDGKRTVDLFVPYTINGREVAQVTFRPFDLATSIRWNAGDFMGVLGLMAELSGMSETQLGGLTYPDVDFVMDEFMLHLPRDIRDQIGRGEIPAPNEQALARRDEVIEQSEIQPHLSEDAAARAGDIARKATEQWGQRHAGDRYSKPHKPGGVPGVDPAKGKNDPLAAYKTFVPDDQVAQGPGDLPREFGGPDLDLGDGNG